MPIQGAPGQGYGKIDPLLRDPSVSSIECSGADKNLTIIRAGQRQMTKIALSLAEINQLLGVIADRAHVPLIQGVFRAAVDNFMIDAVFSDMVSPKFVIKKQTPYAMLE
jgi:type IV secretory pathway ATPase VirB11/archaellum biosynthesis ATPase